MPTEKQLKYWKSLKGKPPVGINNKGKHNSPLTEFKKGEHPSIATEVKKGQRLSPKTEFKRIGKDLTYQGKHSWMRRKYGPAVRCELCSSKKKVEWANVSHQYLEDKYDWIQLCHRHHMQYDRQSGWGMATRKFGGRL